MYYGLTKQVLSSWTAILVTYINIPSVHKMGKYKQVLMGCPRKLPILTLMMTELVYRVPSTVHRVPSPESRVPASREPRLKKVVI